ncbi:serine/threonine protein phosphatase PrpC [Micromonospora pisi]|uniref:Serine/threonine protein phosphatase PrpC n=1 Tax=Micromonospora pisi TaxID=589240 RepID=A0A495JAN6_9ACTN|nr:protein phosphatase 2C domain-containing protein [Micromonospora pisi]RKR85987.1 serine/threonine protein phosphatase PrpC [Micromonospora pisi]
MTECPECAARVDAGDRFCEACGSGLSTGAGRLSSRSTDRTCRSCGATVGSDGYCDSCGRRCPVGRDRCELDLGEVAAATDLGHRRARNEDAVAVGSVRTGRVAVVCDGVSSSPDADAAANVAADTAIDTLLRALGEDTPPDVATVAAFRAAARAVATLGRSTATGDAPSCTFVSAVVGADLRVTVGWAGDSRAYWVDEALPGAPECLTVDDSLAGQLDAAGVDSTRLSLPPDAFGLTRWLGADAPAGDPHLVTFAPSRTGAVVLCSDGLSRYLPSPAVLAQLAAVPTRTTASSATTAMTAARRLTTFALNAGGIDNIAVAVIPVTVGTTSDDHPQIDPRGAPTDE